MTDEVPRHHRPVLAPDLSTWGAGVDGPEQADALAARTAALVMRATADPEARERLAVVVDDLGVDTLVEIWSRAMPGTLAHTLWSLHGLAAWCRTDPDRVAALYAAGRHLAEVSHAIAGAADPPGPAEVVALGDDLARGTWHGDLADACERAAAFTRVVAAGRDALLRPDLDDVEQELRLAEAGRRTAAGLEDAARRWRAGSLA